MRFHKLLLKCGSLLNAPFTIWLLSALSVGIFGTVYAAMQQCRNEADQVIMVQRRLGTEIFNRRSHIYQAILDSKSLAALRASPPFKNREDEFTYTEFKGRKLADLEDEYLWLKTLDGREMVLDIMLTQFNQDLDHPFNLDNLDFSKLANKDMPFLKQDARKEYQALWSGWVRNRYMVPDCGVKTTIGRLLWDGSYWVARSQ